MFARVRVVLTSLVTYLLIASSILTIVAEELPGPAAEWIGRAVVWLATAVTIIRRVTPVLPEDRGLVPPT